MSFSGHKFQSQLTENVMRGMKTTRPTDEEERTTEMTRTGKTIKWKNSRNYRRKSHGAWIGYGIDLDCC